MNSINGYTGLPVNMNRDYRQVGAPDIVNVLMAILQASSGGSAGFGPTDSANLQATANNTNSAILYLANITTNTSNTANYAAATATNTSQSAAYLVRSNAQSSLPTEVTLTLTIPLSPSGSFTAGILGRDNEGQGRKGRLSRINFYIQSLSGGVSPSISIQGASNGNWSTIGLLDSQTLQIVPASMPLDVTKVNQSFRADNDFSAYRVLINNTSGNSQCVVLATFS